jgi:hypothetical protein
MLNNYVWSREVFTSARTKAKLQCHFLAVPVKAVEGLELFGWSVPSLACTVTPLLECFLGHVVAWSWELKRQQREERRDEGEGWVQMHGNCQKKPAATKDDNLKFHRQS